MRCRLIDWWWPDTTQELSLDISRWQGIWQLQEPALGKPAQFNPIWRECGLCQLNKIVMASWELTWVFHCPSVCEGPSGSAMCQAQHYPWPDCLMSCYCNRLYSAYCTVWAITELWSVQADVDNPGYFPPILGFFRLYNTKFWLSPADASSHRRSLPVSVSIELYKTGFSVLAY